MCRTHHGCPMPRCLRPWGCGSHGVLFLIFLFYNSSHQFLSKRHPNSEFLAHNQRIIKRIVFHAEKNFALHGTESNTYECVWYHKDWDFMNYEVVQRNQACLHVNQKLFDAIIGYSKRIISPKLCDFMNFA